MHKEAFDVSIFNPSLVKEGHHHLYVLLIYEA